MAEVKWIKLQVGMFDGMSFKKIRKAKIGGESFRDKLTAVWFELMDFAGQCNHDGAFISPHEIPFHDLSEIAVMIDREEEELNLCMSFFIKEGMITVVDDIYMLTNWERYQNTDGLEKIREQTRQRVAKCREKQRFLSDGNVTVTECNVTRNVTVTQCNALDKDKESDTDIRVLSNDSTYSTPAPKKKKKHKYGEYKNVLLTDEEYEKLQDEFPMDYENRIERLSSYIASKGNKYKSHLATIRNWARKDKERVAQDEMATTNPFLMMLDELQR